MKKQLLAVFGAVLLGVSGTAVAKEHLKSLNPAYIDPNVPAGVDFYQHVNDGWFKAHPLTDEYSRYGQFNILNDSSEARIQGIIQGLKNTNPEPGTVAYKVSNIYEMAMDSVRRNREGAAPIKPLLAKIEKTNHKGMKDLFLWMHKSYGSPLWGIGHMEDMADSKQYAMYVGAAGLGLGDRDYYLENDERNTVTPE